MACMKLGSKEDVFRLEGQIWLCTTSLPYDVHIQIGDTFFHLHKFPLLSRSKLLEKLIQDFDESKTWKEDEKCTIDLKDLPGGANSFLLVVKFCYGVKVELTAANVVSLRCAAEYLQMNESYGEGNLIMLSEDFLTEMLESWEDTIKALKTCEPVLPLAEELHIISRCVDSLATIACEEPCFFSWPGNTALVNKIEPTSKKSPPTDDWWYEDVVSLKLAIFKRIVLAVGSKGMRPGKIAGVVMFYAKNHLPLNGRKSNFSQRNIGSTLPILSDANQRTLIEEITELLPDQKGATPTDFLLKVLRTSMILHASTLCCENLERKIGLELDQVSLSDILIPNTCYSIDTLYDVQCVQRIVDHFMSVNEEYLDFAPNSVLEEGGLVGVSHSLAPMTKVANLLDSYLAEIATDVNLELEVFFSLAAAIPDYSRPLADGIYRAIDIYLKAHPFLTDSEKEHLCRLMNCQKLSLEASTQATQNERLPLRFIVQVLFFEQLHLRTSVAGWLFVSDNMDNSQNFSGKIPPRNAHLAAGSSGECQMVAVDDMKERVSKLEKECESIKQEIVNVGKSKGSWNSLCRKYGFKSKVKLPCHGDALQPSRKQS